MLQTPLPFGRTCARHHVVPVCHVLGCARIPGHGLRRIACHRIPVDDATLQHCTQVSGVGVADRKLLQTCVWRKQFGMIETTENALKIYAVYSTITPQM